MDDLTMNTLAIKNGFDDFFFLIINDDLAPQSRFGLSLMVEILCHDYACGLTGNISWGI